MTFPWYYLTAHAITNDDATVGRDRLPVWHATCGCGFFTGRLLSSSDGELSYLHHMETPMRFLPTAIHGVMDYLGGILLILIPMLWMGDDTVPRAVLGVPIAVGILMLLQAMLTNYECGLVRLIPMPTHLGMDALVGIFLIASPWLFGFADYIWWPHVVLGAGELMAALTTRLQPDTLTSHRPTHTGAA